jgi:hypothetical protein
MSLKIKKQSFMTTRLNPIFFLILLLGLTAFIPWNDDLIKKVQQQLERFKTLRPQEKVYLHTDKPHYSAGETIWFKAYLVDGQLHFPSAPSNIVYVDLVDPNENIIATRNIKIEEGGGAGDFTLDTDLPPGTYTLRAYTNYMRNFDDAFFYKRNFQLFDPYAQQELQTSEAASADFTAQFFPEGGHLVEGLSTTVAVKTVGADGKGVDVQGKILDGNGQQVAFFKSLKFGMGFFSLLPQPGERYTAEVSQGEFTKTFELPDIQERGYVLKVDTRKADLLKVRVQTNISEGLDDAFVMAHIRGNVFGILQGQKGVDSFEGELPTTELPNGIAHFTLFNAQGEAVSERLVFINNPVNQVSCQVETNADAYDLRSEVKMDISLKDVQGEPLQGDLSVSVTDDASTYLPEYGEDIRTYLLLNSDLRGRIENPGYYFEDYSAGRRLILDLLMMTQGWRRFDWSKVLADEFPKVNHPLEQGFALEGTVTKLVNNDKSVTADVFISVMGSDFVMDQVQTEEDGEFLFLGLDFRDTTNIILQANLHQEDNKNQKKKKQKSDLNQVGPDGKRNVDILLSPWYPHKAGQEGAFSYPIPEEGVLANFLEDQKRINVIDSSYAQWSINLDEIVVKARRQETSPELKLANALYREPDHRMILDSVSYANTATDIFQLIRGRFPGVQVRGTFPDEIITMRGVSGAGAAALVLVDGLAMDAETVATINPNDVAVIDILKGASAAFYGSRAINGVVAIYTRQRSGFSEVSSPSPGIINMKHPGYYQAREFYAPTYDKKQPEHIKPDFRTTLFWDPSVKVDKKGEAKLRFYTSDKTSSYRVVVEGISEDGRPVTGSTSIDVR